MIDSSYQLSDLVLANSSDLTVSYRSHSPIRANYDMAEQLNPESKYSQDFEKFLQLSLLMICYILFSLFNFFFAISVKSKMVGYDFCQWQNSKIACF